MRTPREVSESYWAAECRRDIDGGDGPLPDDATYEDARAGLPVGADGDPRLYEASIADFPGLEVRSSGSSSARRTRPRSSSDAVLIDHEGRRFRVERRERDHGARRARFVSMRCYEDPPMPE